MLLSHGLCVSLFTLFHSQETYRGTESGAHSQCCLLPPCHGYLRLGAAWQPFPSFGNGALSFLSLSLLTSQSWCVVPVELRQGILQALPWPTGGYITQLGQIWHFYNWAEVRKRLKLFWQESPEETFKYFLLPQPQSCPGSNLFKSVLLAVPWNPRATWSYSSNKVLLDLRLLKLVSVACKQRILNDVDSHSLASLHLYLSCSGWGYYKESPSFFKL